MKAIKTIFLSVIAASALVVTQPVCASSYTDAASNAWAASSLMNDANFYSRITQEWGDSQAAYEAVAYAGWATDAAFEAYVDSPVGSYTEEAAAQAMLYADDATTYLWMLYTGDYSYLASAMVAIHDASYWMSVAQLFAAWRY